MSASTATVYKGALRSKRKNELVEMATALGLQLDEAAAKRDDVEALVKQRLLDARHALQDSALWAGIYHSIDQSDKRAARSSSIALSPDSDVSDDGRKHSQTQKARSLANGVVTPSRRTSTVASEGAANIANALGAKARRSFEDLSSAFRSGATGIRDEVRDEIEDAATEVHSLAHSVRVKVRRSVRAVESRAEAATKRARAYLSNAQHIIALLLIFEAILLVSSIMPLTSVKLGQSNVKSFVKNAVGKGAHVHLPRVTLAVPNVWTLLTVQFWRPALLWFAWTVGLPLIAAHLITFDRKHEPSSVTFSIVRLAILSAVKRSSPLASKAIPQVVGVAAGEIRQAGALWAGSLASQVRAVLSYDFVSAFVSIDLQILLTSLAAAFAVYEVIAHRTRG